MLLTGFKNVCKSVINQDAAVMAQLPTDWAEKKNLLAPV